MLLRTLLVEISFDQLEQQFVKSKKISQKIFKEIRKVTNDKSAYATWLCKHVSEKIILPEDIYKYEDYLQVFSRKKKSFPKPDIFQYKTEEDIREFEKTAIQIKDKETKIQAGEEEDPKNLVSPKGVEELKSQGITLLGLMDGYQVFKVPQNPTRESWPVYKKHLGNCSGREQGAVLRICTFAAFSHYQGYAKNGPLYVFFNLADPKSPYQVHVPTSQFMNKDDTSLLSTFTVNIT